MSASTSAGEGPTSARVTLTPVDSTGHPPLTMGGGREWWVSRGGGLTLGCRGVGEPPPTITWAWSNGQTRGAVGGNEKILPGGDLHVSSKSHRILYSHMYTMILEKFSNVIFH